MKELAGTVIWVGTAKPSVETGGRERRKGRQLDSSSFCGMFTVWTCFEMLGVAQTLDSRFSEL